MVCPETGFRYQETAPGSLKCLDLDENAPLPESLTKGKADYRQIKAKAERR
jgi:UDP-2-acetamido-3-amino-2,3-dideoxy-glucuronate N-acetyltransferase